MLLVMKKLILLPPYLLVIGSLMFSNCGSDDEPASPSIGFQATSSNVQEGGNASVSFTTTLPSGVTPTFTLGGTATENVDYTYTITSAGITFNAVDDGIYDPDETIIVTLTGFSGNAELGTTVTHTLTIKEEPLVIEFLSIAATRIEGEGLVVAFNQALPAGVTPTATISGTATQGNDYTYTQGQNGFAFTILKDEIYESSETIVIELTNITGNATLGAKNIFTVNITDEDETQAARLVINLTWETENESAGDVDMDLLVWYETSPGVYTSNGALWSTDGEQPAGTPFEATSIPVSEPNGKWGVSYVYYSGTSNNLTVKVNFRSYKGNIDGVTNRASFTATYTTVNINNNYDVFFDAGDVLAQTFDKSGSNYSNLSTEIYVAPSGSRKKPIQFVLDEESRKIIAKKLQRRIE
jgi:hypothetical protein